MAGNRKVESSFVVCVGNRGYPASLEVGKIYRVLPDDSAGAHRQMRVIDESGEGYLYPAKHFMSIQLPKPVEAALRRAS